MDKNIKKAATVTNLEIRLNIHTNRGYIFFEN